VINWFFLMVTSLKLLCHEFPDWVNMVAVTKNNEIILVKQYRHGGKDFFIEVPAGKVDEQEDLESAVIRELLEETGWRIRNGRNEAIY
jgi:8-oxo-dGTP pyrophosphatase MutT (NUDIX family)